MSASDGKEKEAGGVKGTKETFGALLRLARKEAGLTVASFGASVGVSGASVSFWENGRRWPTRAHLRSICAAVPPQWAERLIKAWME